MSLWELVVVFVFHEKIVDNARVDLVLSVLVALLVFAEGLRELFNSNGPIVI